MIAEAAKEMRMVLKRSGDDVDHVAVGVLLHDPVHCHQPSTRHDLALLFANRWPDAEVGHPRFIFDGNEDDALRRSRALADQTHSGHRQALAVAQALELLGGDELLFAIMRS